MPVPLLSPIGSLALDAATGIPVMDATNSQKRLYMECARLMILLHHNKIVSTADYMGWLEKFENKWNSLTGVELDGYLKDTKEAIERYRAELEAKVISQQKERARRCAQELASRHGDVPEGSEVSKGTSGIQEGERTA